MNVPSTETMPRDESFALAFFGSVRKAHEAGLPENPLSLEFLFGCKSVAVKRIFAAALAVDLAIEI